MQPTQAAVSSLIVHIRHGCVQVDLYSGLVEKLCATGLAIQSWRRGIGAMRSSCPPAVPYKSLNVSDVDRVASLISASS